MKSALLIDDDQVFNFLNKRILSRFNCFDKIYVCVSVDEGLKLLNDLKKEGNHLPGLILVDIKLPINDGFYFLTKLSEMQADSSEEPPKIAMLTSSLDPGDRNKADKYQLVCDFIEKPLDKHKIAHLIPVA